MHVTQTPHAARPRALSTTLTRLSHGRGINLQSESVIVNADPSCGDYKIYKARWSEDLENDCKSRYSRANTDPNSCHLISIPADQRAPTQIDSHPRYLPYTVEFAVTYGVRRGKRTRKELLDNLMARPFVCHIAFQTDSIARLYLFFVLIPSSLRLTFIAIPPQFHLSPPLLHFG